MTRIASFLCAAGLALASLTFASSATYEILLPQAIQAGNLRLAPGQYRVTLEGKDAVFTDVRSARSFRTVVTVEDGQAHYKATRISTSKDAGLERMDAMELAGTGTKIEFSNPSLP
jgi:hypothetical protein